MIDRAMTVREVAEYLNVDQKVIYRRFVAPDYLGCLFRTVRADHPRVTGRR